MGCWVGWGGGDFHLVFTEALLEDLILHTQNLLRVKFCRTFLAREVILAWLGLRSKNRVYETDFGVTPAYASLKPGVHFMGGPFGALHRHGAGDEDDASRATGPATRATRTGDVGRN